MKKAKFLILFIICAMALLGGSYAAWSDHLSATDVVKTGVLNLQWAAGNTIYWADGKTGSSVKAASNDPGDMATPDPNNPSGDSRDVGNLDFVYVGDKAAATGTIENWSQDLRVKGDKLTLGLGNGYPGYKAAVTTSIVNTGTVSAKFKVSVSEGSIPTWLRVQIKDNSDGKGVNTSGDLLFDSADSTIGNTLKDKVLDPTRQLPVVIIETVWLSVSGGTVDQSVVNKQFTLQLTGEQWNGDSADGSFTLPSWDNPWDRKRP
ncbi:MAG TPA: hypothetical protein VN426_09330 [Syntrophomonadaceae bacterium]|nr:hypothetical protein [Syntrophomonadaceae bacterium]